MVPLLALAQELVFLGAALAVALLLVFVLRLSQQFRILDMEMKRLGKAQKDGTQDARSRLEEASNALEALEESVRPKLTALEPHLLESGARLDELDERVSRLVPELEAAGRRETEASEVLADARTRLDRAEEAARDVGERFGALDESIRDARTRLEQAEHGLDHLRTALEARLDELGRKVTDLETVPAAPPRQPTRTALGLADRRPVEDAAPDVDAGDDDVDEDESEPKRDEPADLASALAGVSVDEDDAEDMGTGMRGVLIGVIVLAALTVLLHWMGVGR